MVYEQRNTRVCVYAYAYFQINWVYIPTSTILASARETPTLKGARVDCAPFLQADPPAEAFGFL